MKQTAISNSRDRTRRAILEAVADVIMDGQGVGFSIQAVADRAGVTHRTVYNHFPTRDALCEAYSAYVDDLLVASGGPIPPSTPPLETFPDLTSGLYKVLAQRERHVRAYVMLMLGNRRPLETWKKRSDAYEKLLAREAGDDATIPPKLAAAAVRMFMSSMGWHLLTEQCGLSTDEAAATSRWAIRVLIDGAVGRRSPKSPSPASQRGTHATRRRRS